LRKYIWKIKVPLNIKIFMWFLYKKWLSLKTTSLKEIETVVRNVCFMIWWIYQPSILWLSRR
jgi:hypothetical protein